MHPRDHKSAYLEALVCSNISGEMNWAVPTNFNYRLGDKSESNVWSYLWDLIKSGGLLFLS